MIRIEIMPLIVSVLDLWQVRTMSFGISYRSTDWGGKGYRILRIITNNKTEIE